jgi:hypothetical protein
MGGGEDAAAAGAGAVTSRDDLTECPLDDTPTTQARLAPAVWWRCRLLQRVYPTVYPLSIPLCTPCPNTLQRWGDRFFLRRPCTLRFLFALRCTPRTLRITH